MKNMTQNLFHGLSLLALIAAGNLSAAPGDVVEGWPVETDGVIFGSPAIGPEGEIVVGTEGNSVYSFNPDGSLRWRFVGAGDWIDSSPTIDKDGTVYVGSWDNYVYALDGDNGNLKWKFETEGLITASAAIGPDGTLYIGSYDGRMYALHPDGNLKWSFTAGANLSPITGAAVLNHAGDTLYFGTNDGELFALNTSNGNARWSFSVPDTFTDREIPSAPAIGIDGTIFFGCENRRVYSITATGQLNWVFPTTGWINSSPVTDANGTVYFASQDGYLYAVDSVGFQLWETFVGDVFYCSPAIDAQGNIIIAGYAGSAVTGAATAFASVSSAGTLMWEQIIQGYNDSSPNIGPDGSIYIGAHDGHLYKLEGHAPLKHDGWPRSQGNRRQTGWIEDLTAKELVDYFPAITVADNGWVLVPWFGIGWLSDAGLPWINHLDHGYIYIAEANLASIYFYDTRLGEWFYASTTAPNYYFRYSSGGWLYHWQGTNIYTGRWFFDYAQFKWTPEAAL